MKMFRINLNKNSSPSYRLPVGLHAAVVEDIDTVELDDGKYSLKVVVKLADDNKYQFSIPLVDKLEWKIISLFKSAGVYDQCVVRDNNNIYLETKWNLLVNRPIFFEVDDKGIKRFFTREQWLNVNK